MTFKVDNHFTMEGENCIEISLIFFSCLIWKLKKLKIVYYYYMDFINKHIIP